MAPDRGGISLSLPILTLRMVCLAAIATASPSSPCRQVTQPPLPAPIQSGCGHRSSPRVREYALLLLDPDGRILSWNHGAELINGYRPPRDCRPPLLSALSAGGYRRRQAADASSRSPPRPAASRDIGERVRKDGSRFLANVVITAIRAPDGGAARVRQDHPRHHGARRRGSRGEGERDAAAQPDRHGAGYGGRWPDHHRSQWHHPVVQQGLRQPVRLHRRRRSSARTCAC